MRDLVLSAIESRLGLWQQVEADYGATNHHHGKEHAMVQAALNILPELDTVW